MRSLVFVAVLLLVLPCQAQTILVDANGTGNFDTIQAAIDAAVPWDVVVVRDGIYTGEGNRDIDFRGKAITVRSEKGAENCIIDCNGSLEDGHRGFYFDSEEDANSILDGFTISNGCSSSGGGIYCRRSNPIITNCIIKQNMGILGGGGISLYGDSYEEYSPMIVNCIISGNNNFCCGDTYGGGIYCGGYSNPTIINCTISDNVSEDYRGNKGYGGGIYCQIYSNPVIRDCTISGNTARYGGGICYDTDYSYYWLDVPGPTIINCVITANTASSSGGGVYGLYGNMNIANCTISGNRAGYSGGGVYCRAFGYSKMLLEISDSIISNNQGKNGGGLYCNDNSTMISNCTISYNIASERGGGFYDTSFSTLSGNSIFWGNVDNSGTGESSQIYDDGTTTEYHYSCIQDDDPDDANIPFEDGSSMNIDDDPLFVREPNDGGDGWGDNPDTNDINEGANDDFGDLHLQAGSPCIEAGNPGFRSSPENFDIDGQPRVVGLRVDMGADEYAPMTIVTKPAGGEVWTAGSIHEIRWSGWGVDLVDILFSKDGGNSWEVIESGLSETGSYVWQVPERVRSEQCMLKAVPSVPDANVICMESGVFAIRHYPARPLSPPGRRSRAGSVSRTGLSEHYGPESGCVKWKFETDGAVTGGVTIAAGGKIHIASEDGRLYTLDAAGTLLWSYDANSPLLGAATVGRYGMVYVGSEDGRLHAVDNNGRLRWTHSTEEFIYSSAAVSQHGIYVCSADGGVYALGADGSELWSFVTEGFAGSSAAIFASPAIGADGTVYIGGVYDPNLYALDGEDGSIKWVCNFKPEPDPCNPGASRRFGWPVASPVIAQDGTIYQTLAYDPNLYAINPADGNVIWATHLADPCCVWFGPDWAYWGMYYKTNCWSQPALGPDGTIYVSFDDPYLRAVDPNGSIKWATRLGMMGGFTLTVGSDGIIYAASDDGSLYVLNDAGEELSRFDSNEWLGHPVISENNTIVVSGGKDNTMLISDPNNTVWAITNKGCEGKEYVLHRPEDLTGNLRADYTDFAVVAADWLRCTEPGKPCSYRGKKLYLEGDTNRNRYVDLADFALKE